MTSEQIAFFDQLYREQSEKMFRIALRIVRDPTAAADIVEEAFLLLITHLQTAMEHETPVKWLYTVLRNAALAEYRRSTQHAALPLDEAVMGGEEMDMIPFADTLPRGLTEEERAVLTLRYGKDLDYTEIAQRLHATEAACRMKVSRARKHCSELLTKHGESSGEI